MAPLVLACLLLGAPARALDAPQSLLVRVAVVRSFLTGGPVPDLAGLGADPVSVETKALAEEVRRIQAGTDGSAAQQDARRGEIALLARRIDDKNPVLPDPDVVRRYLARSGASDQVSAEKVELSREQSARLGLLAQRMAARFNGVNPDDASLTGAAGTTLVPSGDAGPIRFQPASRPWHTYLDRNGPPDIHFAVLPETNQWATEAVLGHQYRLDQVDALRAQSCAGGTWNAACLGYTGLFVAGKVVGGVKELGPALTGPDPLHEGLKALTPLGDAEAMSESYPALWNHPSADHFTAAGLDTAFFAFGAATFGAGKAVGGPASTAARRLAGKSAVSAERAASRAPLHPLETEAGRAFAALERSDPAAANALRAYRENSSGFNRPFYDYQNGGARPRLAPAVEAMTADLDRGIAEMPVDRRTLYRKAFLPPAVIRRYLEDRGNSRKLLGLGSPVEESRMFMSFSPDRGYVERFREEFGGARSGIRTIYVCQNCDARVLPRGQLSLGDELESVVPRGQNLKIERVTGVRPDGSVPDGGTVTVFLTKG